MSEQGGESLHLPPVTVQRMVEGKPVVVRVDPPGMHGWVMAPEYARQLAALLLGAALAVETLNEQEATDG